MYARGAYCGTLGGWSGVLGRPVVEFRRTDGDGEFGDPPEEGPKVTLGCWCFPPGFLAGLVPLSSGCGALHEVGGVLGIVGGGGRSLHSIHRVRGRGGVVSLPPSGASHGSLIPSGMFRPGYSLGP
jgi:hypothetical protein